MQSHGCVCVTTRPRTFPNPGRQGCGGQRVYIQQKSASAHPTPYGPAVQPVLTSHAVAPCVFIFSANIEAYCGKEQAKAWWDFKRRCLILAIRTQDDIGAYRLQQHDTQLSCRYSNVVLSRQTECRAGCYDFTYVRPLRTMVECTAFACDTKWPFAVKHLHGVPHEEGAAEAGAEGRLRLRHALLRARHLRSQAQDYFGLLICTSTRRRELLARPAEGQP